MRRDFLTMADDAAYKKSLEYHERPTPGKIALKLTTKCETQADLSLAYTPGVASPCLAIKENPEDVWRYTAKGNMVAVVSDGTAVLGLGNIGPEAGLPVMEGKCVLFKRFADIDALPLCLSNVFDAAGKTDADKLIQAVRCLQPTFGGINLEDIASPACFKVEPELKKLMNIPVFHDDQHGTAIISLAGILNAVELTGRKLADCKFVFSGAGAAGIACAEFYINAGARRENFVLFDINGAITKRRSDLTPERQRFADATDTKATTLAEAMVGADVFMGVSVGNCVTKAMVKSMAPRPVVFAMANPTPEIFPQDALDAGAEVVGSGRSDFTNQVNNVLGFPGIFRGALDTRATDINEAMKLGASKALASLAHEPVDSETLAVLTAAYPADAAAGVFAGANPLKRNYVIPKPFDPRVVPRVARHVAEAAMRSGVARIPITDLDAYERSVAARVKANLGKL